MNNVIRPFGSNSDLIATLCNRVHWLIRVMRRLHVYKSGDIVASPLASLACHKRAKANDARAKRDRGDGAIKLPEVSEKARERVQTGDEGYPLITAQNAAAAVERNAMKRGRG